MPKLKISVCVVSMNVIAKGSGSTQLCLQILDYISIHICADYDADMHSLLSEDETFIGGTGKGEQREKQTTRHHMVCVE